jgi:hypothetical protein
VDGDETTACTKNANCKGIGNGKCGYAGHRDWRLPNVKELQSIVDYSKVNPASSVPGSTAAEFYWSSSTYAGSPSFAWGVNFNDGNVNNDNKNNSLRL